MCVGLEGKQLPVSHVCSLGRKHSSLKTLPDSFNWLVLKYTSKWAFFALLLQKNHAWLFSAGVGTGKLG